MAFAGSIQKDANCFEKPENHILRKNILLKTHIPEILNRNQPITDNKGQINNYNSPQICHEKIELKNTFVSFF